MPLDYRLILGVDRPQMGETFQQIQGFGAAAEQDRQQQRDKIAQQVIQETLQQNVDNPDAVPQALRRRGMFDYADKVEAHLAEQKQKVMTARKTELEATKIDLENKGLHPTQQAQKVETELKLIAARNPKAVLEGIATSQSQEDLDHWLGAAKFMLPPGSEAVIATLPTTWSPDVPKWAAQQAMGAQAAGQQATTQRGQDMTAATAAAGQATTQRGQDMTAATAAAGQSVTRRGQDLLNRRATSDGGGASPAELALAKTVFANPALYSQMTQTNKDKIATALANLGFDFAKYGGQAPGGGRPVLAGDARLMTDYTSGLNDANLLKTVVTGAGATGAMPALGAAVPNWVTQMTGFGEGAKQRNAVIARVKQVIGKTLEGGVLRKEDEEKYKDILPTIGDAPEVAASKIDGLIRAIEMKRQTHVESLTDAGFNTAAFQSRFNATAPADKAYTGEVRQSADGRLLGKVNGQVVEVVKSGNGYQVK